MYTKVYRIISILYIYMRIKVCATGALAVQVYIASVREAMKKCAHIQLHCDSYAIPGRLRAVTSMQDDYMHRRIAYVLGNSADTIIAVKQPTRVRSVENRRRGKGQLRKGCCNNIENITISSADDRLLPVGLAISPDCTAARFHLYNA